MRRTRLTLLPAICAVILSFPAGVGAQQTEEAPSEWQYGLRSVEWSVVERLQDQVRDYQRAGAIGPYELRIQANGERFDAVVTAEILDVAKLAELRDLDPRGTTPEEAVVREARRRTPS